MRGMKRGQKVVAGIAVATLAGALPGLYRPLPLGKALQLALAVSLPPALAAFIGWTALLWPAAWLWAIVLAGLGLASSLKPDLILLDVEMPQPNGFEVCHQLKADPTTMIIPVIFLTGASSTEAALAELASLDVAGGDGPLPGTAAGSRLGSVALSGFGPASEDVVLKPAEEPAAAS